MRTSLKCFLATAMVLSITACGGKESASKTYLLTFHQDNVTDTIVTITKGVTTNDDVKEQEPSITPREGYEASWEYDVSSYTTDTTITPTYTPITYYATYKANGRQVGNPLPFTVEDTRVPNEPAVPEVSGYEGKWQDYTIAAVDMTINAQYEVKTYTASFVIDGAVIANVGFTINDIDLDNPYFPRSMMPAVPETAKKAHYDVEWEDVRLDPIGDVTITLTEQLHEYTVQFVDKDGNQVGENQTYTYGQGKDVITEPDVPNRPGYTGAWGDYALNGEDDITVVSPTYTAITYYAVFMADGVQVGDPVPYTIEDTELSNVPNVPEKPGYEGEWESYTLAVGGITVNADYHYHRYYISCVVDGVEVAKVPYTVEDSKDSIELPQLEEKVGYVTKGWEDFTLTYSDTPVVVNAKYYSDEITFDDGVNEDIFTAATLVSNVEVVENEGVKGSKALEVTVQNGDFFLGAEQGYFDAAFANENVKAIDFDAKATVATNNFRNGAGVTFENNFEGYGISTNYKTFHYTRAMYEARAVGENFIKGFFGDGQKLYIDNVRTSLEDYKVANKLGFEDGTVLVDSNNANNRLIRRADGTQIALISGAGATAVDYDYAHKTTGHRSLHITKQNGYLAVFASAAFYNSLPEEGFFFDIYTDINNNDGTNAGGIALYGNDNQKFQWLNNWGQPDDGWVTYHLTKSQIGSDGRFLIFQGSPKGEIYIDNIRAADTAIGFEDGYTFSENEYNYYTTHEMADVSNKGTLCRDTYRNYTFFVNGKVAVGCGLDRKHVSEGKYSFRVDISDKGYCAFFASIPFIKANWERGIKMDIYSEGVTFTGGTNMGAVRDGEWVTITLTKDDFETATIGGVSGMPNGRWFKQNANTAGSFWVDNIRAA